MPKWEYRFITASASDKQWYAQFSNGEEIPDWKAGSSVYDFLNQLGENGWEIVSDQVYASEKWEFRTALLSSSILLKGVREYLQKRYPGFQPEKFSPEALEYHLNSLAEDSWEVVSVEPVAGVGSNMDILFPGQVSCWSNFYFVVLKRRSEPPHRRICLKRQKE